MKTVKYFIWAAVIFTLAGCATMKNSASFFGTLNIGRYWSERTLQSFFDKVRPARGNSEAHYLLARYYQQRGKHAEAIAEFEKVLAIEPGHAKALNAMGVSYDHLKDFTRAFDCYQAALILDPDSANIYYNNMGQSLLMQGKFIPSIESFKMAAAYDEDFPDPRVHNNLGRAYAMIGYLELALAEFELAGGREYAEQTLGRILAGIEQHRPQTAAMAVTDRDSATKEFYARVFQYLREQRVKDSVYLSRLDSRKQHTPGSR
jgi:tetratricopeptide (TPR) repeat protein